MEIPVQVNKTTPNNQPDPNQTDKKSAKLGFGEKQKINRQSHKAEKIFREGMVNVLDLIAPSAFKVTPNYIQLENYFIRSFFVYTYPRFLQTNWLSPIVNFDITADISMFIYPMKTQNVMSDLRTKVSRLESTQIIEQEKGYVRNPELETAISDIEGLRDVLQRGEVKLFQYALYFTIYANSIEELNTLSKQLESTLGGMLIYTKQTMLQMEQGFNSSLPLFIDEIDVKRNLDTGSLSTTFPFVSTELTSNSGILYGLNRHNNSLILFDRFKLENANSVVFAKAGAGKSFAIKLELLRSLMFGTEIVVIDPENEYKMLCDAVGGSYLPLSLNSKERINPFDLPKVVPADESGEEVLRNSVVMVKGLASLMVGGLTPEEDAILDKAIYETYSLKDITADPDSHKNPPPLMSDLQNILTNMTGAEGLARKLAKYVEGTFAGLFNKPTNFDINKPFVVFSIRDLEEQLRPIGMYLVLNYIWNKVRFDIKKRILVVDEAWIMMQHEDSAKFLYAMAKRCRKYFLGLTVITQDVEDFLNSQYGRAVINNSSMQLLLKQSTASIDQVAEVFNLTEGEKTLLLESNVGQGLFFAGMNHVAIEIIPSYTEKQILTTDPAQLIEMKRAESQAEPAQEETTA
jgi:type IV secretory pathway VirB4 component